MTAVTIEVRYFAAARAAAGIDSEKVEVADTATVADLLLAVRAAHGEEFGRVLDRCSFLLDEVAVRDQDTLLGAASALDVLPPFAGG
ncbi:MoaD/ThiS family protein [Pseudonocardia sp.]|uniref:MoaD/ThiS family protein n=1 Tax=Pseudonocardia sp. TaxID=60912 RepID=UPI003D0B074C